VKLTMRQRGQEDKEFERRSAFISAGQPSSESEKVHSPLDKHLRGIAQCHIHQML
jgi:hypothetical protein